MTNDYFYKRLNALLYFTIIAFTIGDILRKFSMFLNLEFIRYTAIAKTTVLVCYILTIIFSKVYFKNPYTRKLIYLTGILVLIYISGQIILLNSASIFSYNENILILSRYLFWPLTLIAFLPLITDPIFENRQLKLFEYIFLLNALLILISFLFDINFFVTYDNPNRFGFMGFYNTHNQASYYFIMMILYYYYLSRFKNTGQYKLIFILLVSLLIGTKKIYLFLLILATYDIIKSKVWKEKYFYIKILATTIILFFSFNSIKAIIYNKFKLFFDIYHESGFLSSITSFRNEILISTINETIIESWRWPNYILGGPKFYEHRSEFGFIDLYVFFGLFGLYFFYKIFGLIYTLTNNNKFFLFVIISLMTIAFFAEGFFSSANQPLMFLLISGFFIIEGNKFKSRT